MNTNTQESNRLYTVENNRQAIKLIGNKLEVDEDTLDIFSYYTKPIPAWEPTFKIKPYSELSKIYLDIETAGLDANIHRIFMIGLINELGDTRIITHENEIIILTRFIKILTTKNPDILATFNGFDFDIRFIIRRCEINGIPHPFYVRQKQTVFRTAVKFNQPTVFNAIYLKNSNCALIDLFHQVLAWDFVARKLTSHSLKESTLQMGLREDRRLELMYEEMLECWDSRDDGGLEPLKEYLKYDLEDTKLLGDRLIPSIYYQKLFLDWSLQSLSTGGNGTKWNSILESAIPASKRQGIETSPTRQFKGGLTAGKAGFYRNVIKVDVSSLYPSIMLTYGIHGKKDVDAVQLQILKYMRDERLRLKKLAKTDAEADQMQGAMKVMINSAYGVLGCTGIPFNDYEAAALVTAYGRAILKEMIRITEKYGGYVIEADTDGLCITCEPGKEQFIWEKINQETPKGIEIEYEWTAKSFFVPPAKKKNSDEGLKKNYIIIFSEKKMKANGKYRKRDKCILEKTFQPEMIKLLTFKGKNAAIAYYDDIIEQLSLHEYPLENLIIKRTIKVNEKTLVQLGLGKPGEQTWYYYKLDKVGKMGKQYYVQTQTGDYSEEYYIDMINIQYEQIMRFV